MKVEDIIRMGELQTEIDRLTTEMDKLKALARLEANGEARGFHADGVTVTVSKVGKPSVTLDTNAFKVKAPKLYAEVFGKYSKMGAVRAASVRVLVDGE